MENYNEHLQRGLKIIFGDISPLKKELDNKLKECKTNAERMALLKKELSKAYEEKTRIEEEESMMNIADRLNSFFPSKIANDEVIKHIEEKIEQVKKMQELENYAKNQVVDTNDDEKEITIAKEKYEYLKQLGFFDIPDLKPSYKYSQTARYYILSKILGVGVRTARGMMNNEQKYVPTQDTVQKVKDKLNEMKNRGE